MQLSPVASHIVDLLRNTFAALDSLEVEERDYVYAAVMAELRSRAAVLSAWEPTEQPRTEPVR